MENDIEQEEQGVRARGRGGKELEQEKPASERGESGSSRKDRAVSSPKKVFCLFCLFILIALSIVLYRAWTQSFPSQVVQVVASGSKKAGLPGFAKENGGGRFGGSRKQMKPFVLPANIRRDLIEQGKLEPPNRGSGGAGAGGGGGSSGRGGNSYSDKLREKGAMKGEGKSSAPSAQLELWQQVIHDENIDIHIQIPRESTDLSLIPPQRISKNRNYRCTNQEERFTLDQGSPKPDFIFIGVAKGGSTSFSAYIADHPNYKGSPQKEPNFFTYPHIMGQTPKRYQSMFVNVDPLDPSNTMFAGEFSTDNIVHPLTARRILTYLSPQTKIIMFLRNPIDRAYSQYIMQVRAGQERYLPFEEIAEIEIQDYPKIRETYRRCFSEDACDVTSCFADEPLQSHDFDHTLTAMANEDDMMYFNFVGFISRSVYDDQVERYLSIFPRENILIYDSDFFYDNTVTVMTEITEFIGMPYIDWSQHEKLKMTWGGGASNSHAAHDYPPLREETRARLRSFFEPYNQRLFKLIGREFDWQ